MADTAKIPLNTLEGYLYGKSVPTLEMLQKLCNNLKISSNECLKDMMDFPTEQKEIGHICALFEKQPEFRRDRLYQILEPLFTNVRAKTTSSKDLGSKIRLLRIDADITIDSFISQCCITADSLKMLEANQWIPSLNMFLQICRVLQVSPEYMMYPQVYSSNTVGQQYYSYTPKQLKAMVLSVERLCAYVDLLQPEQ